MVAAGPLLIFLLFLSSCVNLGTSSYDQRRITFQTINDYNQRDHLENINWRGDWMFRRDRLELIDSELRQVKPDIIVFQEFMTRRNSTVESDQSIFSDGALTGYQWSSMETNRYFDTDEIENAAIAVGLPLVLDQSKKKLLPIGNGYISYFRVVLEEQPIAVFNLKEPHNVNYNWLALVKNFISATMQTEQICLKRMIVAGEISAGEFPENLRIFQEQLSLKDIAQGLCENENKCHTQTPTNELFYLVHGEKIPTRKNRILIHSQSIIYSSNRNLDKPKPLPFRLRSQYQMGQIWPSTQMGWVGSVRLPKCTQPKGENFSEISSR